MWKSRHDFEAEIVAKAWQDPAFKTRLIQDPKAVVEEVTGEKLPMDMKVAIMEETRTSVCLILPRNPDEELSDNDLEKIAGGIRLAPDEQARLANNIFTRL